MTTPFTRRRLHTNLPTAGLLALFILLFGVFASKQMEARSADCLLEKPPANLICVDEQHVIVP